LPKPVFSPWYRRVKLYVKALEGANRLKKGGRFSSIKSVGFYDRVKEKSNGMHGGDATKGKNTNFQTIPIFVCTHNRKTTRKESPITEDSLSMEKGREKGKQIGQLKY